MKNKFLNNFWTYTCFGFFLYIILNLVSASAVVCCTASDSPETYCQEFEDSQEAYSLGCENVVETACEFSECGQMGCCSADCSFKRKSQCLAPFAPFTDCGSYDLCRIYCCVQKVNDQISYVEGIGSNYALLCNETGGKAYPTSCSNIPDIRGSFGGLSGNVVDQDEVPLSGVEIHLGNQRAFSDSRGNYKFENLPIGTYVLSAYLEGYFLTERIEINIIKDVDLTKNFFLESSTDNYVIVRGRVLDSANLPLQGTIISFNRQFTAISDSLGYYELVMSIDSGTYQMVASKTGYESQVLQIEVMSGLVHPGNIFILPTEVDGPVCGNGILEAGEECEFPDIGPCPGQCDPVTCKCPETCESQGYFCADLGYQCLAVNGRIMTSYNADCNSHYNIKTGGGICCNSPPLSLPVCLYGETSTGAHIGFTDISQSGGEYCKCGNHIEKTTSSTSASPIYCCVKDGERSFSTTPCVQSGVFRGRIYDEDGNLEGARIQLSALYSTVSNSSQEGNNFIFNNVAPGRYQLKVSKSGYNDLVTDLVVDQSANIEREVKLNKITRIGSPLNLNLEPVKGSPGIKLIITIGDLAGLEYYTVDRNGIPFKTIPKEELDLLVTFVDRSTIWENTYTYNVTAYGTGNIVLESRTALLTTGNSVCQGIVDEKEFCASTICFANKNKETCRENDNPPFSIRAKCNANNFLVFASGSSTNSRCQGACISIEDGKTLCQGESSCVSLGLPPATSYYSSDLSNIFGLFYDRDFSHETCTQTADGNYKFCYFDYFYSDIFNRRVGSYSIVDQCLNCHSQGSCYDYQSQNACEQDNCKYGSAYSSECVWQPTFGELGRGICYLNNSKNKEFCRICDINNPIFYNQMCTQESCSLLGACLANPSETRCLQCEPNTLCESFSGDQNACQGRGEYAFLGYPQKANIQCNSSTEIRRGDDICAIGFCRYNEATEECFKDANFDGIPDCGDSDDVACLQDVDVPVSNYVGKSFLTKRHSTLEFDISGEGTLYYCISDIDNYCCPNIEGGPYIDFPNQEYDFENFEGMKRIWYFMYSKNGIPEEIKYYDILVDKKPPEFNISYRVDDNPNFMDKSNIVLNIQTNEIARNCKDILQGSSSHSQMPSVLSTIEDQITLTYSELSDGTYIYNLECEDVYGNKNSSASIVIDVDRIKMIVNAQPNLKTLNTSLITLSLETPDREYHCFYTRLSPPGQPNQVKFTDIQATGGSYSYFARDIVLAESETYRYKFICYDDEAKNSKADETNIVFTLDKKPPVTSLKVFNEGQYVDLRRNIFYANPRLRISCEDQKQGPPQEFGCSEIYYCVSEHLCNPVQQGISVTDESFEFNLDNLETGSYKICMQSRDKGNNLEEIKCLDINIDISDPMIEITTPSNNAILGQSSLLITGTWKDERRPNLLNVKIVNQRGHERIITDLEILGERGSGTFRGLTTLSPLFKGINTIHALAIDGTGNYNMVKSNFYYDLIPPNVYRVEIHSKVPQERRFFFMDDEVREDLFELSYKMIALDKSSSGHHEYSYPIKFIVYANDDEYMDLRNERGDDVKIVLNIINSDNKVIATFDNDFVYNETDKYYELELFNINGKHLPVGNYTIQYVASDVWNNTIVYEQKLEVDDTIDPFFQVQILDKDGNQIDLVRYGEYDVIINASEPLKELRNFSFTFRSKVKQILILDENLEEGIILGRISIPREDLDFLDVLKGEARFTVYGVDKHGRDGSIISSGERFFISTRGPLKPFIVLPELDNNKHYSNLRNIDILGIVYKSANELLTNGKVVLMYNSVTGDLNDRTWRKISETFTAENLDIKKWDFSKYDDEIIVKSRNEITIHDPYEDFEEGMYIEFDRYPTKDLKAYKIISKSLARLDGPKKIYDISVDRDFEFYDFLPTGTRFYDSINIYESEYKDGIFGFNVDLEKGENYFYALAYDGPNPGSNSDVFTIIYDNEAPQIYNTSPMDNSKIGNENYEIYAKIDMGVSDVKDYVMRFNGADIVPDISYTTYGFVKFEFEPERIEKGINIVEIIVEDLSGNILNYKWSFELDQRLPRIPRVSPLGFINRTNFPLNVDFYEDSNLIEASLITEEGDRINLQKSGGGRNFILSHSTNLKDGKYLLEVKSSRIDNENVGEFIYRFDIDTIPPRILNLPRAISSENIPFSVGYRTSEYALCRHDFKDRNYGKNNYNNFKWSNTLFFSFTHLAKLYDIPDVDSELALVCIDRAGNVMTPEYIHLDVKSLLYPKPNIIYPRNKLTIQQNGNLEIFGNTFGKFNTREWVENVNLIISRSSNFLTNDVKFEEEYYANSFKDSYIGFVRYPNIVLNHNLNAIELIDNRHILQPGLYVEFPSYYQDDYGLFKIRNIEIINKRHIRVYLINPLPSALTSVNLINVYEREFPPGIFKSNLNLEKGVNTFYVQALNGFGRGIPTQEYTVIYDDLKPEFVLSYPSEQEKVSGKEGISIVLDGTYSNISNARLRINEETYSLERKHLSDNKEIFYSSLMLNDGLNNAFITFEDQAGNKNDYRWSFVVDSQVPDRPLIIPNGRVNSIKRVELEFFEKVILNSVKISGANLELDITSNMISNDGGKSFYYNINQEMSDGEYYLVVSASKSDSDLNFGIWKEKIVIDNKEPRILNRVDNVQFSDLPLNIKISTDKKTRCYYGFDRNNIYIEQENNNLFSYNNYLKIFSKNIINNVYILCEDEAGNKMQSPKRITFNQNVIVSDVCGDSVVSGIEECDINNNQGIVLCSQYNPGFVSGFIKCDLSVCRFDTSSCIGQALCLRDSECPSGQVCDNGYCKASHCYNNIQDADETGIDCGGLNCDPCPICGNGIVEKGETCDGSDWGSITSCEDLGFIGGELRCGSDCKFDTSSCKTREPICGNGIIEEGEQCETNNIKLSCQDFGFSGGQILCKDCQYSTEQCEGEIFEDSECGDGLLSPGRQCDGLNINVLDCSTINDAYLSGLLSCSNDCMLDMSSCVIAPKCNDGILQPGEECDPALFNLECSDFGSFKSGDAFCDENCKIDTSKCSYERVGCGDGILQPGEQCDFNTNSDLVGLRCSDIGKKGSEEIVCSSDCMYEIGLCEDEPITEIYCGNGLIDEELGEQCEPGMIAKSCRDLGFNVDGYPSCFSQGDNKCHYDVRPCGSEFICKEGQTKNCRALNPVYIYGEASCVSGFYDMSKCYWQDTPQISLNIDSLFGRAYISIVGTVSKARILELYVNGIFVEKINFDNPESQRFNFENVFLRYNTLNSNGINKIKLVSYGAVKDINSTLVYNVVYDTIGPEIKIIEPDKKYVSNLRPTILLETSKRADCRLFYGESTATIEIFNSENKITHILKINSYLQDNQLNTLKVLCKDEIGNEKSKNIELNISTRKPLLLDVDVLMPKNIIEQQPNRKSVLTYTLLNHSVLAKSDFEVICKYGFNENNNYETMSYFLEINNYLHEVRSRIIRHDETDFKLNIICKNKFGVLSDIYELIFDIDVNTPIIITKETPDYVSSPTPNLNFSTNRPADCEIKHENTVKKLIFSEGESNFLHYINSLELGLRFQNERIYEFEVLCTPKDAPPEVKPVSEKFTITSDQVPPFIVITHPNNNDVFTVDKVIVSINTEKKSTVSIEINEEMQGIDYTENGSITFSVLLNNGKNTINVKSVDKAENENSTSINVYFIGERISPKINSIYPENNAVVSKLSSIKFLVETVYGSNLDLSRTIIELKDSDENKIVGIANFVKGSIDNPEGNLSYNLMDDLIDGHYVLRVKLVDEHGNDGVEQTFRFEVNKDKPILTIRSPISYDSEDISRSYRLKPQPLFFYLDGRIESRHPVNVAYIRIDKGRGSYGDREELILSTTNRFNHLITFDELQDGNTRTYRLLIEIDNGVSSTYWRYPIEIVHDLQAPVPSEVRVDNKLMPRS